MSAVAYERWVGGSRSESRAVIRALREARLDSFLADSQDDGVAIVGADGRLVEVNAALVRRTGAPRAELLGSRLTDLVAREHRRRIDTAVTDALAGDGVRARARGAKRSGGYCELALTFVPLLDPERTVVGALVITQNLTEAAEAERDRQRDERLLELAGRIAGFTGWSLDLATGSLDWSGSIEALDDDPPASLDDLRRLLDPVDAARLARAIERADRERRMLDITVRVTATSVERHVRFVGETAHVTGSRLGVLRGAAHDVTDAIVEQRQRLEVEQLLSTTLDALTDGLGIVDAAWRFTFVNERLAAMIGVERDDLVGASLWEVAPELGGTEFEIGFRSAVEQSTTIHVRDRLDARDAWLEAIAYPSGGGLAVLLRDVTEVERAAERYREAQGELARLGRLLDISREAIVVSGIEHDLRYANEGARELYGWHDRDIDGAQLRDLVAVDEAAMDVAWRAVLADGHWAGRVPIRTLDGRERVLASRMQLMLDADGAPEAVLSVAADITEEVAREENMRRAERMESLGTFAGGIAHDLNNVLTPILMASQMLGRSLESTPDHETAAMIESAARRGADMVRQVLAFARGLETRTDDVDLTDVLTELRGLLTDTVPPEVDLRIDLPAERLVLSGDATQLLQVLVNLVGNAVDAIDGPGSVTVDARLEPGAEGGAALAAIRVTDTGHGIGPEAMARVWEPFFTTKAPGKGTGLGLPMVAAIVRAHGGAVDVDSDGRSGTTFTLRLPVARIHSSIDAGPVLPDAEPHGEGELVLVVDDEPAIRTVLRQVLRAHGYDVVVAASGDDAAELIASGRTAPALVLSDVMMPRGTGIDLVERLADSGIPVILMSGRQDRAGLPETAAPAVAGFLEKPLTTSALLTGVRRVLDARRPAVKEPAR